MRKWVLLVLLTFLATVPLANAAMTRVEVSTDNVTFQNITHLEGEINDTRKMFSVFTLEAGRTYFFRVYNSTHDAAYFTHTTKEGVDSLMAVFATMSVFLFLTTLVVVSLFLARKMWLKVVLSLALSLMITILLRLAGWWVEILYPAETALINTLGVFYGWATKIMYILVAGALIFMVVKILNILRNLNKRKGRGFYDTEWFDSW